MNLDLIRAFIAIFLEGYLFSFFLYLQKKAEREWKVNQWVEQNRELIKKQFENMHLKAEWIPCKADTLLKYYKDNAEEIHKYFKSK